MEWKDVVCSNNSQSQPYALLGNGELFISIDACNRIDGFDSCAFITFVKTVKDRLNYVGIKFRENQNLSSFKFLKTDLPDRKGIIIKAKDILFQLFGKEALSKHLIKKSVVFDKKNPNVLIIYNNFIQDYYVKTDNGNIKIRRRHVGTTLNSCWLVVKCFNKVANNKKTPLYLLKNTNTGEEVEISSRALFDIEKGLTTVERIKKARTIGVNKWRGIRATQKRKRNKHFED